MRRCRRRVLDGGRRRRVPASLRRGRACDRKGARAGREAVEGGVRRCGARHAVHHVAATKSAHAARAAAVRGRIVHGEPRHARDRIARLRGRSRLAQMLLGI